MLELVDRTNLSFVDFYHKRSSRFSDKVIIPKLIHTRFVVAGADVIHSYACPPLGIKNDGLLKKLKLF